MPAATKGPATITASLANAIASKSTVKRPASSLAESAAGLKPAREISAMNVSARALEFQRILSRTQVTGPAGARRSLEQSMVDLLVELRTLRGSGSRLYIVGNGGSAGVASHAVTDFLNVAKLRASTLHDPSLLTCMSNDYGYEVAFARIIATMASEGDMMIAISSSGQ